MRSYGFSIVLLCILISACGKADYQTVDGNSGRFADLRGRWVLINYWASWCEPCIKEIPELNRFNQQYSAQAAVFAVNFDGIKGAELQQQAAKLKFALPVLSDDPAALLGYRRPEALPSTFVFGPDGKLKQVLQGEQTVASLAAAIGIDSAAPAAKP
jgi:thiol-disulfide isomerase/thioredoxin